jgi:hypothetical protein
MPVTYSFITTLTLPVSDEFPCFDARLINMPVLLYFPEIEASRGSPYFSIDGSNRLVIYSDDGVLSALRGEFPFEDSFTFETTFLPSDLPDSLDKLDQYRFFIGVFDKQDGAGGILISRAGIALVSSFGSSSVVLPGSQHIFTEGEIEYTLRMVIDGSKDVMYLYVTRTSDLPITGQVLRYTTAAPITPTGTPDSFRVEVLGTSAKPTCAKFESFRCNCTAALIPNQRPIADPGMDQTANLGSAITHDGRNSYDPEGAPLTYYWDLVDAPDGSRYKVSGAGGSTSDEGDADGFTDIFDGGVDAFSAANAPVLQPGDVLQVNGINYTISTSRWTYNPTSFKWDRNPAGGWVDNEVVITEETLPDNLSDVSWTLLHSRTYFNDYTSSTPVGIPDISGVYMAQLIVNDGELNSLPVSSLLNVSQTSVALGCIPELSWVWNLLSDFWNLLEDREIVETVWSGFAQAAAAQLLTAWQIDYNKSLLDIQRVFQRRWLSYDTNVDDDPDTATVRVVRGPVVSGNLNAGANVSGKTFQLVLDNGYVQTVSFSGVDPLSAETIAEQINQATGYSTAAKKLATVENPSESAAYLVLDYPLLLRIRPGGTANGYLGFSTTAYTQNDLSGALGGAVSATKRYAFEASDPPILDFDTQDVGDTDLLVMSGLSYRIQKTAQAVGSTDIRGLTVLDELPDPTDPKTPPGPWAVPSVVNSSTLDFEDLLVGPGDIARFEVKDVATGKTTEVYCQVLGSLGKRLGFDPLPLLQFWNGNPDGYETVFAGIKHVRYLPVDPLVVEIPRLQEVIKDPPSTLEQNTDFTIELVGEQNAIIFKSSTFSYMDPPPDTLWAEITHLDNRPTIDANFGTLVNFNLDQLKDVTEDLDYLSAVRGLWWAYFGGPALDKVRTGVQILLGLPFTEAPCTITSIKPDFSAAEGRLIAEDANDPNHIRTYYYPRAAGLGINRKTGLTFAEGDEVDIFTPLCGGVEVYDFIENPSWVRRYVAQNKMSEVDKLFRFLVRADVDTFNIVNLSFAVDFVRKIKPAYTYPLFVMLKKVKTVEVDVMDSIAIKAMLALYDSFCSYYTTSAYRWDDTDESGHYNYNYDDPIPPPRFLFDTHRLCPVDILWCHIFYIHNGVGGWFYDTIWAYDDGGGRDRLTLHGPDHLPPPPYGPEVGVILMDTHVTAGTYHRIRRM